MRAVVSLAYHARLYGSLVKATRRFEWIFKSLLGQKAGSEASQCQGLRSPLQPSNVGGTGQPWMDFGADLLDPSRRGLMACLSFVLPDLPLAGLTAVKWQETPKWGARDWY